LPSPLDQVGSCPGADPDDPCGDVLALDPEPPDDDDPAARPRPCVVVVVPLDPAAPDVGAARPCGAEPGATG